MSVVSGRETCTDSRGGEEQSAPESGSQHHRGRRGWVWGRAGLPGSERDEARGDDRDQVVGRNERRQCLEYNEGVGAALSKWLLREKRRWIGVDSWWERKGEREKICVPELGHPFDAQNLLALPFLPRSGRFCEQLLPQRLSLPESSYERRRIDPPPRQRRRDGGRAGECSLSSRQRTPQLEQVGGGRWGR